MGIGLVGGLFDAIIDFVGDFFLSLFDLIPKSIYLLAAVFLSVIDVLQCLVRKLAGLDIYWVNYPGNMFDGEGSIARVQVDPLTEFIYGILGYGDARSVAVYKGLNSVFLSLAVFAVICLVVTSMIAIIKSHYNEDVAGTNPWKYIYTAIKAVFTFAIVPFVVVVGLKLSSWMLQTLDSIVASSATEEAMKSMYGSNADKFNAGYIGSMNDKPPEGATEEQMGQKYYARYDMFTLGVYTSSTPFSGMLFKACAYSGNRARKGYADGGPAKFEVWTEMGKPDPGCGIVFFSGDCEYFGKGNGLNGRESKSEYFDDKKRFNDAAGELVAQQVDYAFMNNLSVSYQWYGAIRRMNVSTYFIAHDLIMPITIGMWGFSKFHVGLVWEFYNLWEFNFIVAFAGGTTMVGIMLSVIIGLMSRLLKSAVLFLIYPALLGIAPLDNFKAFKSWTTQFIQQIMMAFGAIIGMNLTLLILPYANNFAFFNIGLVDALVNCIIVITGLMMMKDIIAMISNFAGGADANAAGSALKGEVGKAFAGGAKTAGKLGLKTSKAVVKGGIGAVKGIRNLKDRRHGGAGAKVKMRQAIDNQRNAEALTKNTRSALISSVQGSSQYQNYKNEQMNALTNSSAYKSASKKERKRMQAELEEKLNSEDSALEYFKKNQNIKVADGGFAGTSVQAAGESYASAQAQETIARERAGRIKNEFGFKTGANGEIDVDAGPTTFKEQFKNTVGGAKEAVVNNMRGGLREGYTQSMEEGQMVYRNKDGSKVSRDEAVKSTSVWKNIFDEASMKNAGKELADGFLKGLTDITSGLGMDKMLKGMSDIFKEGTSFKGGVYDKSDKKEGDELAKSQHKEAESNAQKRAENLEEKIDKLGSIIKEDLPGSIKVAFTEALKGATFTAGGSGSGTPKP